MLKTVSMMMASIILVMASIIAIVGAEETKKRFFFCFWFHVPLTTISKFVLIHLLSLESARANENKRNKNKVE